MTCLEAIMMYISSILGERSQYVTFIRNMQNKNHRLTKWGLMLQEYNLIIKHIKCKDNFIANILSRVG
jgi:hypothetical protein